MEFICAYFDVQGFYHGKTFYPRELALASKRGSSLINIDHGITLDSLSEDDKKAVVYNLRYGHGLPFDGAGGLKLNNVRNALMGYWKATSDPQQPLVAVKSAEAEAIFKRFKIPVINLLKAGATWETIACSGSGCWMHVGPSNKCSLLAVNHMKKWVINQLACGHLCLNCAK